MTGTPNTATRQNDAIFKSRRWLYWHVRMRNAILLLLLLAAASIFGLFVSKVQNAASQMASLISTTISVENEMFAAIHARRITAERFCLSLTTSIEIPGRRIEPVNTLCAPPSPEGGSDNITRARQEVDTTLASLDAYAKAVRSIAARAVAPSLIPSVSSPITPAEGVTLRVLNPPNPVHPVNESTLTDLMHASKEVSDAYGEYLASGKINRMAKRIRGPLATIAKSLRLINATWTSTIPGELTGYIKGDIIALWHSGTYTDRQALYDAWQKVAQPISAKPADKALTALVAANNAVARHGLVAAAGRIKDALLTAKSALAVYVAMTSE